MQVSHTTAPLEPLPAPRFPQENFPVASWFMPFKLRHPIKIIYRFARMADDIADEGNVDPETRLKQLDYCCECLEQIAKKQEIKDSHFQELAQVIYQFDLPIVLFQDLLTAFKQDVTKNRYANFAEVMQYCRHSANPIGRLLLKLFQAESDRNLAYSDAICTSLQLINFLQDISIDYQTKNRIYLPQDELKKYQIEEKHLATADESGLWEMFMLFEIERARKLLQSGAALGQILTGRLGLEMRLIIAGGETILRKMHKSRGKVLTQRPVLQKRDYLYMIYRALKG